MEILGGHMQNRETPRFRLIIQPLTASLFAIALALQSGCTTIPVPKTQHQATLGKVAVVATLQEPEIKLEVFAHSKGEGAAKAAGGALFGCAGVSAELAACPPCAIVLLGICSGVAVPVSGLIGGVATPSSVKVQTAETNMTTAMSAKTIQEALREQVVSSALAKDENLIAVLPESARTAAQLRDYRSIAAAGVDTVLEVSLIKVSTEYQNPSDTIGIRFSPPLLLSMTAHVRLVRTRDNMEIFATDYVYQGNKLTLEEWSSNQAKPLLKALQIGYETLGSHIYDNVFLLYPFPDRSFHSPNGQASTPTGGQVSVSPKKEYALSSFGLAPIDPPTRGFLGQDDLFGASSLINKLYAWFTVGSLRPTLHWEAFPRASDITVAPEEMGRVKNIRYDLIIARENYLAPAEVVYSRQGLSDTMHTIEISLSSNTRYFWTVRARFELDGRVRVTEWGTTPPMRPGQFSSSSQGSYETFTSPSQSSYRFRTP